MSGENQGQPSAEEELPIPDAEKLARFLTSGSWIRNDGTIRPDAFIPHPYNELSVTRHIGLSEEDLWGIGREVVAAIAATRPTAKLLGRADLTAGQVRQQKLSVNRQPIPGNVNHADIVGWPPDKPTQKSFAQELSAAAGKHVSPPADQV